jgi:hypothetical protein
MEGGGGMEGGHGVGQIYGLMSHQAIIGYISVAHQARCHAECLSASAPQNILILWRTWSCAP